MNKLFPLTIIIVTGFFNHAQAATLPSDGFSIVVLPDTQYYSAGYPDPADSNHSWPFDDQVNWVVAHRADTDKKIQLVIGVGDIMDDAGPRPAGQLACRTSLETNYATQWVRADNAIKLLDTANIPYAVAVGNHDYDCQTEHNIGFPQSRSTSNFDKWFGPARYASKSWFNGGRMNPNSNANFYNIVNLGGKDYLVLILEFYPRDSVLTWANGIVQDYSNLPVIVAMHAFLAPDGATPGSAHRVMNGDPDGAGSYHLSPTCAEICTGDQNCSTAVTADCDNGNNGSDMWTKFVSKHKNIVLVVNGHFRYPSPGPVAPNYTPPPNNNGVGYLSEISPMGQRIDEIVSDYQGQGNGGYFGNGYLRLYTITPSAGTLQTTTLSPPAAAHPTRFPKDNSGKPAVPVVTRTDSFNQYTIPFENWYAQPVQASVTVQSPAPNTTVSNPVTVSATYSGSIALSHFEVWMNGIKLGNVTPASGAQTMSQSYSMSAGAHALTVLAVDSQTNVIKSTVDNFTSTQTTASPSPSPSPSTTASVTIQSPALNTTVSSPVTVSATYSGSIALNHFEVWMNGTKLGNVTPASGVTTMSQGFTMSAGAHALTVLAVDSQKNVIKSTALNFTSK